MNKDSRGFSVVEGLLIIVVIGLVGLTGWYVSSRIGDKSTVSTNTSNPKADPPKEYKRTAVIPNDWVSSTNDTYDITFKHPANWTISSYLIPDKKVGEDNQTTYSLNASEVFVICYKDMATDQYCMDQITINNQPFDQSLAQLRDYYNRVRKPYKETAITIDGHRAVEFRASAQTGFPADRYYLLDAHDHTYGLTTVYEGDTGEGEARLTAAESLALFESIEVK